MAEIDAWVTSISHSTSFFSRLSRSVEIVRSALHLYRPRELVISFNGGKDCTAILHLVRYVLYIDAKNRSSVEATGEVLGTSLQVVYFYPAPTSIGGPANEGRFREESTFMTDTASKYGFVVREFPDGAKAGLSTLAAEGVRAVFMGTRRTDPHGGDLDAFTPTSLLWPPAMRVCPLLHWDYGDVWSFLRGAGLPVCDLYARGYTSLGSASTSRRNPALLVPGGHTGELDCACSDTGDACYRPAWELQDGSLERAGRCQPDAPSPAAVDAAVAIHPGAGASSSSSSGGNREEGGA